LISPGARIGPFQVLAHIGSGGMGEVYRATDTNLARPVALKVLPAAVAGDGERLARFEREARTLAGLNHPNVAQVYGFERTRSDGSPDAGAPVLVMELVDGDDLAAVIARGAIPAAEAVAIARQLVDALEAAHEQGVVHRDFKPANIKLRPDGTVKVLDFGLAKALASDGTESVGASTVTSPATGVGTILGTAAYMAPEQARGKPVDKRADIWAFGAVLYEMLSGRRVFGGDTVSDTLAAVLTSDPDWSALPATTPPGVRRLLRRCLEQDVKRRLRDIGDARLELEPGGDDRLQAGPGPPVTTPARWTRLAPWLVAAAASAVALATLWSSLGPADHFTAAYVDLPYPRGFEPVSSFGGSLSLSPDGKAVATIGSRRGVRTVFVRRFDQPEAVPIPDTAGVNWVAFSPDSRSIAFVPNSGHIVRVSLVDQQRRTITESGVDRVATGTWGADRIVFSRSGELWIVSSDGGEPRQLTRLDPSRREVMHADPIVLPMGRIVLFASMTSVPGTDRIEAIPIDGSARSVVMERATTPAWSTTGHLLFARDGAVMAAPADAATGAVRGPAVTVIPAGVIGTQGSGTLGFRLSATGTLLFLPAESFFKRLVSVDRQGAARMLRLPPGRYSNPRVAPDGLKLLVERGGTVIEALDLASGSRGLIAPAALGTSFSTWTAGGEKVVLRRFNLPTWVATDGSAREGVPPGVMSNDYPSAPAPDPEAIVMVRVRPETSGDIYLLSLDGSFQPRPLVSTPAYEGGPQLSPDGRWLLYQSDESGTAEIYVRRYPALDKAWRVSSGGGLQPRWNGSGEICYRGGLRLMGVPFNGAAAEPALGKPQPLFEDEYDFGQGLSIANYDVTKDGRFIMLRRDTDSGTLRAVLNWTPELMRLLAAGGAR
jgi:serine/threonine protein kinase